MKKQTKHSVKAHLLWSALILLVLVAVCAIPFALGQRQATKRTVANSSAKIDAAGKVIPTQNAPPSTGAVGASAAESPAGIPVQGHAGLPATSNVAAPASAIAVRINPPAPQAPNVVLYDQINNPAPTPGGVTSQDFETVNDPFDSFAADDFVVPAGQTWNITEVDVSGEYSLGGGPAASFHVFFYQDSATLPGTLVATRLANPYSGGANALITLTSQVTLTPGTYWVAVQSRQDFTPAGQWFWDNRAIISNSGAAWQNPGGGFGVGCLTYGRKTTCLPTQNGPDQLFRLVGTLGGASPTPTGTPSPTATATATPCTAQYVFAQIGGSIVPGTTDSGNHGDDVVTTIALPFSYTLYDTPFASINVSSNGPAQFVTMATDFTNVCLPWAAHNYTIFGYWDDQRTDNLGWVGCTTYPGGTCGVYTSVSGTAPNRIFNIEWRAVYFANTALQANHELRLYEGQTRFDVIYGTVANGNSSATAGVQKDVAPNFTQYFCNGTGGAATGGQSYTLQPCGSPTPTPTATATATPTVGVTATPTCIPSAGKIYNIAGFGLGMQTTTTRIYDIATNSWTTGAPIPEANGLSDHATAYSNGIIYVAGGYNGAAINTVRAYNIATNTWSVLAPLPQALYLPGFGIINGKLYIAAGNNGSVNLNTLYIYDIATNMWTTGAVVPTPVVGPGSAVYQGKLYLFGGANPFPTTITTTQIYDPVLNTWSAGPNMNVARLWFYGANVNNTSIVAPGGDNSPGIPINDNEQLTGTWAIRAPLPFASRGPFAVSDGTFVYIGGGYDGTTVHTDTLRYDPVANSYTPLAPTADGHYLSQAVFVPGGACGTPTATPTGSPTATATATAAASATPTPTATCVGTTITKPPDLGPFWFPLSPNGGSYVYSDSFVPQVGGSVSSLGTWLNTTVQDPTTTIRFQVWGSVNNDPTQGPDASNVIATSAPQSGFSGGLTFYSAAALPGGGTLVAGNTYWFVATVVGSTGNGQYQVGGHTQNSIYQDNGTFWYSNDPNGVGDGEPQS